MADTIAIGSEKVGLTLLESSEEAIQLVPWNEAERHFPRHLRFKSCGAGRVQQQAASHGPGKVRAFTDDFSHLDTHQIIHPNVSSLRLDVA